MILYAVFFCMQVVGSCRLIGPTGIQIHGQSVMTYTFPTLADCERAIAHYVSTTPQNGRYYQGLPSSGVWYECRHRHFDTWESGN